MRRDYFDAHVHTGDEEADSPGVTITFDGPERLLSERLERAEDALDTREIDVTYRLTTDTDVDDASGVLSVADRLTGEFVLEANVESGAVDVLVEAAKRTGGDEPSYRLRIVGGEDEPTVYDKEMLLVYDADGSLLRQRSLIPGGVEL